MGKGLQGILAILLVVSGRTGVSCDAEGVSVRNEQLLTLAVVDGTAVITVTSREGGHSHYHPFPREAQISPACSAVARSSRCRRLYIDSLGDNQFLVIVALDNGVGMMLFRYNGAELILKKASFLSTLQIGQCVPLEIVHFDDHPMVFCLNQQQLLSCDIEVNLSDISQSSLACLHLHNFPTAINYEQVSNFVYFTDLSQVVVIIQQLVFSIRFESRTLRPYVRLDDPTCDGISYIGDHTFHITCRSGQVFQYNTDTELFSRHDGTPVPCPSSTFTLIQAGNDTVVRYNKTETTITRLNFTSGVCSPAGVLYIVDHLGGITVFNAVSGSLKHLNIRSRHLEVFSGEYLVVLSDNPSKSVLYNRSLESIAERHGEGQAVGVISSLTIAPPPPTVPPLTPPDPSSTASTLTTQKPTTAPSKKPMGPPKTSVLSTGDWTGVGIGVFLLIFLIGMASAISVIVVYFKLRNSGTPTQRPIKLVGMVKTANSSTDDVRDADVRDADVRDATLDGASSEDEANTDLPVTTKPIEAHNAPAAGSTQQVQ